MDWQTTAAIIASIGAVIISLYTAKSSVRKSDIEALQVVINGLKEDLARWKEKYEELEKDYERLRRLYVKLCAFVRRLGYDPEAIDEE